MNRMLFAAALAATFALSAGTQAQPPRHKRPIPKPGQPAPKPPDKQGIVPGQPSDPVSDFGLGATGYVLAGQGYVLSSVKKNGAAKRVGLEAGDIVRSVDGKAITSEATWTLAMKGKDRVALKVLDGRDPTAPPVTKNVNLKQ